MPNPFETDPGIGLLEAAVNDDCLYQAQLKRMAVAEDTRPAVENTLSIVNEETVFHSYGWQYARLPDDIKKRCNWHTLCATLLANGGEKFRKAEAMQGGGELFGIDSSGRALIKDRGTEPVMYGFDQKKNLIKIYDRNPEQMKEIARWANVFEIRDQVHADGYELFTLDRDREPGDEMKQAVTLADDHFVVGKNRNEYRASCLKMVDDFYSWIAFFNPDSTCVPLFVDETSQIHQHGYLGAIRLLRV